MYINTNTLAVYKSQNEIRLAFPNSCFPITITDELLVSFDIKPVMETTPIFNSITEKAIEIQPILINNDWTQQWQIVNKFTNDVDLLAAIQGELDIIKESKINDINTSWLEANANTFTHDGYQFDCNTLAQQNIATTNSQLANIGGLPPGWIGGWKTFDNQWYPITTYDGWKAFYSSMFMAGIQNFGKAQTLKNQIRAIIDPTLESIDLVKSINW